MSFLSSPDEELQGLEMCDGNKIGLVNFSLSPSSLHSGKMFLMYSLETIFYFSDFNFSSPSCQTSIWSSGTYLFSQYRYLKIIWPLFKNNSTICDTQTVSGYAHLVAMLINQCHSPQIIFLNK